MGCWVDYVGIPWTVDELDDVKISSRPSKSVGSESCQGGNAGLEDRKSRKETRAIPQLVKSNNGQATCQITLLRVLSASWLVSKEDEEKVET